MAWRPALVALLVACGSVAFAATASAVELTGLGPARLAHYQRWVDRSLVPTTRERVALRLSGCPGSTSARACTSAVQPAVYLFAGAGRFVLMHELGHRFDYRMPASARARFQGLIDDQRPWWSPGGPAERFADAYAACAVYGAVLPAGFVSSVGYAPTAGQHRAACRLIRQTAQANPSAFALGTSR